MKSMALTPEEYLSELSEDRKIAVGGLREVILENLPNGFREVMSYGMIGYVIPHELYPPGYHCDPRQPLPLMSIASQKNFIAFYHMGIYAIPELQDWFKTQYPEHSTYRLDMGKSCIRFKGADQIPYALIGSLVSKVSVQYWISVYESVIKK